MSPQDDRGPQDYDVSQEDVRKLLRGLGKLLAQPPARIYHNGDRDDHQGQLLKWILGVLSTLLTAAVVGGIVMYGELTAIKAGLGGHEQRIDRLEREPRYRGSTPP